MKRNARLVSFPLIASLLLAPLYAVAQSPQGPPPPFTLEPVIKRLHDTFAMNDEQTAQVREVFARHETRIKELRQRAQTQAYSQKFINDFQKAQSDIREEIMALLTEEQKAKAPQFNMQLPVPLPPPFMLIPIAPRQRPATATNPLAVNERLIPLPAASTKSRAAQLTGDQKILHLLNRATFGARPGDLEEVKRTGVEKFLDAQLHPETQDDSEVEKRLAVLPTLQLTIQELYQYYPPPPVVDQRMNEKNAPPVFGRPQQVYGELVQQKLVRAVSSNRQLQEVMTDFWFNHFNVFAQKDAVQWMVTGYEREVIRPNALGRFQDLLLAVAESPAMMFYLDNWLSSAPDARLPRPPRPQNFPNPPPPQTPKSATGASSVPPPNSVNKAMRSDDKAATMDKSNQPATSPQAEKLNPPAPADNPQPAPNNPQSATRNPQSPAPPPPQPGRKPGINENYARELLELHTMGVDGGYTQKDVQEVARCFTGWTIDRPYQGGGFVFRPWMHDNGSKTVLGVTIPAGGGISDGRRVIEILSRHPSTAKFIAKKLCQRLVADNPAPQLVERIAQVFLKTDGDIAEVLRAIFTSPEFNAPAAFRSKLKSPLELVASAIRAVDGDTSGTPQLNDWLRKMGEPLYQQAAPTGYKETSEEWMNAGLFLNRLNFGVALANQQIPATSFDVSRLVSTEAMSNADLLMKQLTALITHTELSNESQQAARAAFQEETPQPAASQPRPVAMNDNRPMVTPANLPGKPDTAATRRAAQLIGVLFGTAEFQRK